MGPSKSKVSALSHRLIKSFVLDQGKELWFKTKPRLCLYNFQAPGSKGEYYQYPGIGAEDATKNLPGL